MIRSRRRTAAISILLGLAFAAVALLGARTIAIAQEDGERSRFVRFVERQISTPNRQIRLGRIEGALSSDVRIASITVADREGVWLRIEDARLVWSRLALLRGRLDVDRLEASSIVVSRAPLPDRAPGDDEPIDDTPFQVPELPVSIELENLAVPRVEIAEGVIGPAVAMSVDGRVVLAGGDLDVDVAIERLDRPGTLSLETAFSNRTRILSLDLVLSEPENGVVANALSIEGRPPIELEIAGEGPLDDYAADIRLAAAGEDLLTGRTTIAAVEDGLRFRADVDGDLSPLVPARYDDLVDAGSSLSVDLTRRESGAIDLASATLTSGVLRLALSGALAPDGVPTRIDLDARLGREDGAPVPLPGGGGEATVRSGRLSATLGGPIGQRWNASFLMEDLDTPGLAAARATVGGGGEAVNMADPDARRVTFDVSGGASGLSSQNPDIADALGESLSLAAVGAWTAGEPATIREARLEANGTRASFAGSAGESGIVGDFRLAADDLAAFAGIAERSLAGAVDLSADGSIRPGEGLFDLSLDGTAEDLAVGVAPVDGLLAGTTTVSGRAARAAAGFTFDAFAIDNPALSVSVDGQTTAAEVGLVAQARIADLAAVDRAASGALDLEVRLTGANRRPEIAARLRGDGIVLAGEPLSGLDARVDGRLAEGTFDGAVSATADLAGAPLEASGAIVAGAAPLAIRDLRARVGTARLAGSLVRTDEGPFDGRLALDVPALADLAPLLLAEARGSLSADISLSAIGARQDASLSARVEALSAEGLSIGFADVDLAVADATGVPRLDGAVAARDVRAGSFRARSADLVATRSGEGTRFDVTADLARARLEAAGTLAPLGDGGFEAGLERLRLAGDALALALDRPATVSLDAGTWRIADLALGADGGRLALEGTVGDTIDLSGRLESFPLAVADLVVPDLGARGTLSGTLEASGSAGAPRGTFRLSGSGIATADLAAAGLPPIDADLAGRIADDVVALERATVAVGSGSVAASGTIGRRLDLAVRVERLPVALANAVAPDLGLDGALTARADVTGTPARPRASFTATIPALSAAPLSEAGIDAVAVAADGRYENERIRLERASVTGAGLEVSADGTIPLSGRGLDVRVTAAAPLSLAQRFTAERGATIDGRAAANVAIRGSLAAPRVTGEASAADVRFVDPESGLVLSEGSARATFDGERVTLERFSGALGDGTISASGTVALDPRAGFPADLSIALRNARYTSGDLVTLTASGDLSLTGPLLTNPLLAGEVRIERAEINIASRLPGGPTLIEVAHIGAPPDVLETLRRARVGPYAPTREEGAGAVFALRLDVTVSAPRRIFVRGRGVDAELGGEVRLTGSTRNIVPIGAFEMIRGRIEILTQRIVFDRGTVTLVGDLDPLLDFVAETSGNGITVTITVSGTASAPSIELSSSPDLPQDEILAQLLFGKSINDLSGFQLAQLAASAASLAGGGGPSPLEQFRRFTGLDDFDVVTDEEGDVGVRAGRYVADNVYLGVETDQEDTSLTVNLDVTRNLKLRGSAGTEESSLGFFFEREY